MTQRHTSGAIAEGVTAGLRLFRWLAAALFILFWCSGITTVAPGEIAVVLRLGKLAGTSTGEQIREPGLLLAFPYPIDQVVRIPVKQEGELVVDDLWKPTDGGTNDDRIEPLTEGYCLTGDQNLIQPRVIVKYRISDPIAFRLRIAEPERMLRETVVASLTQEFNSWKVDEAIRLQRPGEKDQPGVNVAEQVQRRTQARLDSLSAGITIAALEFKELHPTRYLFKEFQQVQSAKIGMETLRREAEGFAAQEIPRAQSERNRLVQEARAFAATSRAKANEETSVFVQLHREAQKQPQLLRERLYQECVEAIFKNAGKLEFVAPETRILFSDRDGKSQ